MSSVLRSHTQIPATVKYFIWLDSPSTTDTVLGASSFSLAAGDYADVGSMISVVEFDALTTITLAWNPTLTTGSLLKDLGRQITFYDGTVAGKPHVAVYREVQVVNGPGAEGVGGTAGTWNATYFVKVWEATPGTNVNVVRTG